MQRLTLAGHYGTRSTSISAALRPGLVRRLRDGATRRPGAARADRRDGRSHDLPYCRSGPMTCARVRGPLKIVHDQSRWGRSLQLRCLRGTAPSSFAEFLEEKGLLRPMSHLDRARLLRDRGRIDCVNCGGAIGKDDERCPYCRSIPSLLDVARLARALDPLDTVEPPAGVARPRAGRCSAPPVARPAAGRNDQLLAVRRDPRDHALRRGLCGRPALARRCATQQNIRRGGRSTSSRCARGDLPRQREWRRRDGGRVRFTTRPRRPRRAFRLGSLSAGTETRSARAGCARLVDLVRLALCKKNK